MLLSDAEGIDDYGVYFVIRLYYGDPALQAYRMTVWNANHVRVFFIPRCGRRSWPVFGDLSSFA